MRRYPFIGVVLWIGLALATAFAQSPSNLVESHQTQIVEDQYTQIDFKLRAVPESAMLSFDVRFEPRFV